MSPDSLLAVSSPSLSQAVDSDGPLSQPRVASLSQPGHRSAGVAEDDGSALLVPGTSVVATTLLTPPSSPQPPLPLDDVVTSAATPPRPTSATPPFTLPNARTLSSTAASASSSLSSGGHGDALNSSDSGLHLSGEKPVRSLTGSLQPAPSAPSVSLSRQLSRQSSNSDAPLPSRSSTYQSQYHSGDSTTARVLRVTNEALSLRKQSLRHAAGSLLPTAPIEDVATLRALLSFQNAEIASYKQQITQLTQDNNRLAAEVRAFPHSASEVTRVINSLREERTRMDGRIRALEAEKKVWAGQMRNLHGEMNSMEREWIKDRQRLEEAVRREEERNERLVNDWDEREERMNALARERKREQEELDRCRAEGRELERRLEHAQAEYARVVNAWREERLMGSEVEGRVRGEAYSRLFRVLREVAAKEAESREWEREMGRKREVQAGVEELERRYVQLLAAVDARDELLGRLREDNRRLLSLMRDESEARAKAMRAVEGDRREQYTATAAPSQQRGLQHAGGHTDALRPLPFPLLDSEQELPRPAGHALQPSVTEASQSQPNATQLAYQRFAPPPLVAAFDGTSGVMAGPVGESTRAQLPTSAPTLSSSTSQLRSTLTASKRAASAQGGDEVEDSSDQPSGRATLTLPSPSAAPASASASLASLRSPTAYLSAFFASAAATLVSPRAEQPVSQQSHSGNAQRHRRGGSGGVSFQADTPGD